MVDCRPLQYLLHNEEHRYFIISSTRLLSSRRGLKWLFVLEGKGPSSWLSGIPGDQLLFRKAFRGATGWRFWYKWQLPALIRKYKPDLVLTTGDQRMDRIRLPYGRWNWQQWGPGAPAVIAGPASLEEKETTKRTIAGGREYFLADISRMDEKGCVDLLKAFSLFKKRQRSNLQLVLTGRAPVPGFVEKLATYKYREDIHIDNLWSEPDRTRLLPAAYAAIMPLSGDRPGIAVLDAWKVQCPVIALTATDPPQWAAGAVLTAELDDPASLAAQLMALYKDEALRNSQVQKAGSRIAGHNWEDTADKIWEDVMRMMAGAPL